MKNKLSLYEISDDYALAVENLLELDIDEQTFNDTLEGLQGDFRNKAVNLAYFIKNLEVTSASIKQAEERMYERRKMLDKKLSRLREYLICCMDNADILKIDDCPDFSIKIRTNPPSLVINDENEIPDCFWHTPDPKPVLDKLLLKSDLKEGREIPGAELVYNKSLQIK